MTMMPQAPAIVAWLHRPEQPLAYARPGDGYGWFLIDRESRCVAHVRGPFETEEEALAIGRVRQAARAAAWKDRGAPRPAFAIETTKRLR